MKESKVICRVMFKIALSFSPKFLPHYHSGLLSLMQRELVLIPQFIKAEFVSPKYNDGFVSTFLWITLTKAPVQVYLHWSVAPLLTWFVTGTPKLVHNVDLLGL